MRDEDRLKERRLRLREQRAARAAKRQESQRGNVHRVDGYKAAEGGFQVVDGLGNRYSAAQPRSSAGFPRGVPIDYADGGNQPGIDRKDGQPGGNTRTQQGANSGSPTVGGGFTGVGTLLPPRPGESPGGEPRYRPSPDGTCEPFVPQSEDPQNDCPYWYPIDIPSPVPGDPVCVTFPNSAPICYTPQSGDTSQDVGDGLANQPGWPDGVEPIPTPDGLGLCGENADIPIPLPTGGGASGGTPTFGDPADCAHREDGFACVMLNGMGVCNRQPGGPYLTKAECEDALEAPYFGGQCDEDYLVTVFAYAINYPEIQPFSDGTNANGPVTSVTLDVDTMTATVVSGNPQTITNFFVSHNPSFSPFALHHIEVTRIDGTTISDDVLQCGNRPPVCPA